MNLFRIVYWVILNRKIDTFLQARSNFMSFILLTLNLIDLGDIIDIWVGIKKMKVVMLELTTTKFSTLLES